MIHALHGHAGLPDDLMPLLRFAGQPFQEWHLWRTLTNHPESASLDGFATLLNDTASHDGHHLRILLGYSLGGRLALHALTQQPQMWDAAIILSAHPGLSTDEERAGRLTHDQAWAAHFLHDSWPEVMAAWNEQAVFRSSTFQCRVECADLAFDFGAGAKRRQTAAGSPKGERSESKSSCLESWREQIALGFDVWSLGRQQDLRPRLASVACPVLWLTGVRDEKFTALAAEACDLLPRARHVIIPNAGHRVHLDQPDAVAEVIAAFLRSYCTADGLETGKPVAASGASS